jgi:hypothetical protein
MSTETAAAETVVGTVLPPVTGPVVFPVSKLVFLGLVGMVGALAIVLFQVLHERDELRRAYTSLKPAPHTANGKFDGTVTPPAAENPTGVEASPESPVSEV